MAIFASTTTSGYSDPLKAMSIKALEQRQKDLLAQQAAQQPDAAMMATIPGGIGHVLGQVGDMMQQRRSDQALAAQKQELAATMAGVDLEKGPTAQQLAKISTADPELLRHMLTTLAENRRAAAANLTTQRGQDVTARGQDVVAGTTARGQDITARGQDITSAATLRGQDITARGQDITTRGQDIVSADTTRGQDITARGQDVGAGTAIRGQDVTARGQDIGAGTTIRGQDVGAATTTRGQDVTARGQDIGAGTAIRGQDIGATTATRGQDVTARGQDIGAGTAERGQDITQRGQDITTRGQDIETADRAAKLASEERIAAEKVAAKAAEQAADPKRASMIADIGTKYVAQVQASDKLEKALHILDNGGINTGPWARAETAAANLTNGKFGGTKEMAQRTTDFNSIVNEHAIKQMSETLKGQTTDMEMQKFLDVLNNPNASPERRREALVNMINASKVAQNLHAEAVKKVDPGAIDRIHATLGGGGGGAASKPTLSPEDTAAAIQDAKAAINSGTSRAAVIKRLQDNGIDTKVYSVAKIKFDDLPKETRKPAGPPSVPISGPNLNASDVKPDAAPPISRGYTAKEFGRKITFDDLPPTTEAEKSAQRIREIAGQLRGGEKLPPGPLDTITDAASLGTSRPISAAITAGVSGLRGSYPGSSYDERYKALIQYMNDRQGRADENTGPIAPLVRGIASIPASMATGGGSATAKAITGGTTAPARTVGGIATNPVTPAVRSSIPAGTTETAARAAIPGFIEGASQNAESLESAVKGGAKNAALSAGVAAGLDVGTKKLLPAAGHAAEAEATAARGRSPDEIRNEAKAHFNVLDNNGVEYSPQQTANLYQGLHQLRNNHTYVPGGSSALDNVFNETMTRARQGMTFNELDNARSAIATLARGPDESTRVAARAINNEIDRMIGSGPPAINPNNVNVDEAYNAARGLWRQKALVEDAMFHADNVDRKTAINTSADPNKAMKAEFGAVEKQYDKSGAYDPLASDPEGREMLARIVRGGPVQNAMASTGNALSGRFAPWAAGAAGIAVPTALGVSKNIDPLLATSLGAAAGVTAAGTVNQTGKAFQRGAANLGEQDVNAYMRHLSGSPAPVPGAAISRDDLVKILFAQDLERLAPRVGSGVIGNQQEQQP